MTRSFPNSILVGRATENPMPVIRSLEAAACLALCLVCALPAHADQLVLSNGDRVTGKITKKDGGTLTLAADLMGEVTIPWGSGVSISSEDPLVVVLSGGKSVLGRVRSSQARKSIEVAAAASTETAPLSDIVAIRNENAQLAYEGLENPGLLDLWDGFVDLGLSAARGNARTNTLTTAFNASRVTRADKLAAYFNQIYATARIEGISSTTAEAVRGGWSHNRNLNSL